MNPLPYHKPDPSDAMPAHLQPMLACRATTMPGDHHNWAAEYQWSGVRTLCHVHDGVLRMASRFATDITDHYPELQGLPEALGARNAIFDGQIVALSSNDRLDRTCNNSQSNAARSRSDSPIALVLFDLLYLDDSNLMDCAYAYRRLALEQLNLNAESWRTPPSFYGDYHDVLLGARCLHLSGLVLKRVDSVYRPGEHSGCWLSIVAEGRRRLCIDPARAQVSWNAAIG